MLLLLLAKIQCPGVIRHHKGMSLAYKKEESLRKKKNPILDLRHDLDLENRLLGK